MQEEDAKQRMSVSKQMEGKTMRNLLVAASGSILWICIAAHAQSMPAQSPYSAVPSQSSQSPRPQMGEPHEEPLTGHAREQQSIARNSERQKKLAEDTTKLLALATELKEQVDKTNKDILSVDVVKKADEIEKLAKSVKDRMKGSSF
jgi:hypothetical protein